MTLPATIVYWGLLGAIAFMALLALIAGWWSYTLIGIVLGAGFATTGRFVFGRRWRPPPPKPTRRPVVRRPR